MDHALLAPSSAHRWLRCTPSARLEQTFTDKAGDAAEEGTLAHEIGENMILRELKILSKVTFDVELERIKQHRLYKPEMLTYCQSYADYVIEQYHRIKALDTATEIFTEKKLEFGTLVPEGFGRGDCFIIGAGVLRFIDLKYGKGVPVTAIQNEQMSLYTWAALDEWDFIYGIKTVEMTIFQPRLDIIDTWETTPADLYEWAEKTVRPAALKAWDGEGEYVPGEKQCMFCKAKPVCKALAEYNLELAKHEFADGAVMEDSAVADVLARLPLFEKWAKAVKEHALLEAVHAGKQWPGFKLVEGRSNRKYSDVKAIIDRLTTEGFSKDVIFKPQELEGITTLEGVMGKKTFNELVGEYVVKPPGKPVLVPNSDKRTPYSSLENAAEAFGGLELDDDSE